MKYSIVIPTQDRPKLLEVVAWHAMAVDHSSFEVIVSDNSTSDEARAINEGVLSSHLDLPNFRLVRPPRVLSAPEHFEYALPFATGDYVLYLTDKMVILPHLLSEVDSVIAKSDPDIVNWAYAPYDIDDIGRPDGSGTLTEVLEFLRGQPETYAPNEVLRFKASSAVPRNRETIRQFALGKIVFGCYKKSLIERVVQKSGTLFRGATHDYSAMVQALALAEKGVMINRLHMLFIALPRDKSLGSLTATEPKWAMYYYNAFTNGNFILENLLIPNLYASQHNMVAHDYKKFLPLYGKQDFFKTRNWFVAILNDLTSDSMIWGSDDEKKSQIDLFMQAARSNGPVYSSTLRMIQLLRNLKDRWNRRRVSMTARFTGKTPAPTSQTYTATSVVDAINHIITESQATTTE